MSSEESENAVIRELEIGHFFLYYLLCNFTLKQSATFTAWLLTQRQWTSWLFQYCFKFKLERGEKFLEAVKLKGGHNYEVSSPYKLF